MVTEYKLVFDSISVYSFVSSWSRPRFWWSVCQRVHYFITFGYSKAMAQSRRSGGSFRERRGRVEDISESDLTNPWNFFKLFMSPDDVVITWCREHNLIANTVLCSTQTGGTKCGGTMDLKAHSGRAGGAVFRCRTNRNHEKPFRTNSFFEKSNLTIQDIMLFVKSYLDKCTLLQCSIFCGLAYGTTAVNWASFIRELFKEHFHRNTKGKKLQGEIEIDESLFGRRVKYHRGNPNAGLKVSCTTV